MIKGKVQFKKKDCSEKLKMLVVMIIIKHLRMNQFQH